MVKNIFEQLLKEATDEIAKVEEPKEETTEEVVEEPKDKEIASVEEPKEETTKELSQIKSDTQDLIMSILDAIEQDELAQGNTLEDDESADVGLELLHKLIPKLDDADAKEVYDTLSDYFEMELGNDSEEDKYFEEPTEEVDDLDYTEENKEDEIKVESKKKV